MLCLCSNMISMTYSNNSSKIKECTFFKRLMGWWLMRVDQALLEPIHDKEYEAFNMGNESNLRRYDNRASKCGKAKITLVGIQRNLVCRQLCWLHKKNLKKNNYEFFFESSNKELCSCLQSDKFIPSLIEKRRSSFRIKFQKKLSA